MQNVKNMYIRGMPVDTPIGKCHFIKMSEQEDLLQYQQILFLTKEDLFSKIEEILNITRDKILPSINPEYVDTFDKMPLIDIIKQVKELKLYDIFKVIYDYFLGENVFDSLMTDEDLLITKIQVMGKLEDLLEDNEELQGEHLFFNMIKDIKELCIYNTYNSLFNMCFKDAKETFSQIVTYEQFQQYKQLIIDMNCVKEPVFENPNPEIEKFNKYDRILDESKSGSITYESMYTSLWLELRKQPEDLTIYQFNKLFNRINHFKSYDASTNMYSTKVHMWFEDDEKKNETIDDIDDENLNKAIDTAINNKQRVVVDI